MLPSRFATMGRVGASFVYSLAKPAMVRVSPAAWINQSPESLISTGRGVLLVGSTDASQPALPPCSRLSTYMVMPRFGHCPTPTE
jgi:hypothetical protein